MLLLISRLLEDRTKTACWRISVLTCVGGKLVGLGFLEVGGGDYYKENILKNCLKINFFVVVLKFTFTIFSEKV